MQNNNGTRTVEILEQLKAGVEAIQTSEQWQEYLKMASMFTRYSFNNVMLIAMQKPGATRVAGFRTWKKLGRHVNKGEKGIRILAPLVVKKKEQENPDDEGKRVLVGFRTVAVFDVSQTGGEELASDKLYQPVAGDEQAGREALEKLWKFSEEELEIPVTIDTIQGKANGYLQTSSPRAIVLREGNDVLLWTKTLAHELGHALLHLDEEDVHSRPHMEVEAESVAFVVMTRLGFDASGYSFPFVAGWANGDADQVMKSGERIQRIARRIIDSILSEEKEQEREAA